MTRWSFDGEVGSWPKAEIEVKHQNSPAASKVTEDLDVGNTTSLRQSLLGPHWQLPTLYCFRAVLEAAALAL
jgi:hypothetical protein